ncbi:MAG: hypothetical protein KDK39_10305 [Leptospiraceae bacterium]|nr:hypothetical protein [Leptospiraceae bacterium]
MPVYKQPYHSVIAELPLQKLLVGKGQIQFDNVPARARPELGQILQKAVRDYENKIQEGLRGMKVDLAAGGALQLSPFVRPLEREPGTFAQYAFDPNAIVELLAKNKSDHLLIPVVRVRGAEGDFSISYQATYSGSRSTFCPNQSWAVLHLFYLVLDKRGELVMSSEEFPEFRWSVNPESPAVSLYNPYTTETRGGLCRVVPLQSFQLYPGDYLQILQKRRTLAQILRLELLEGLK